MPRRTRPHHLLFVLLLIGAVLVSGPAAASIGVAGTGEPRFTNSDTNTAWFSWTVPSPPPGQTIAEYDADLVYQHGATGQTGTTGATGATGPLGATGPTSGEAPVVVTPAGGDAPIDGHTYGVCVLGRYSLVSAPATFTSETAGSCQDASATGKRTGSIIDRGRPAIQVKVNNGVAVTGASVFPVRIDYSDALAPPFPANFVCLRGAVDPATAKAQCDASSQASPQYAYDAHCSAPTVAVTLPGAQLNAFVCNIAAGSATPDGPVTFCAIAADAAIPDNPASSNQSQTADRANLSPPVCGSTVLDRSPPSVEVAAPAGVPVGDTLSVSAAVADPIAGLAGDPAWDFGDGATATGATASHVFARAGTYTVTATVADAVGNVGHAAVAVVATLGAARTSNVHGGKVRAVALTSRQLAARAGAGARVKRLAVGDLQVLVPDRLRLPRTGSASLPMALATARKGTFTATYTIAGRRLASAGLQITRAGSLGFALRLAPGAVADVGQLVLRFTAAGAPRITAAMPVRLVAAKPLKHRTKHRATTVHKAQARPFVTGAPRATLP